MLNIYTMLKYLHNPFIFSVFLGTLVTIAFIVDSKIYNKDRDRNDYLKIFGTVLASVLGSHYFLKSGNSKIQKGGSILDSKIDYENLPSYGGKVFAENPDF